MQSYFDVGILNINQIVSSHMLTIKVSNAPLRSNYTENKTTLTDFMLIPYPAISSGFPVKFFMYIRFIMSITGWISILFL